MTWNSVYNSGKFRSQFDSSRLLTVWASKGNTPLTYIHQQNLILSRIYGEIGPGERISLSKLAIDKYEETGRPLRVAIDVSIWQFQIRAGQGMSIRPQLVS